MPGFGRLPGLVSIELDPPLVMLSEHNKHLAKSIVIDSSVRDSGSTPTTRIRPGKVLALETSSGRYVESNDSQADLRVQATTTSLIAIAAWNTGSKTFKWKHMDGTENTVTGGTADTAAQMITDLNADAAFKNDLIASAVATNKVKITARRAGEYFKITDGTVNDQGGVAEDTFADNTEHQPTEPDIVVLNNYVDLIDANGTARHAGATGYPSGEFKESNLLSMSAAAKAILKQNGSIFR